MKLASPLEETARVGRGELLILQRTSGHTICVRASLRLSCFPARPSLTAGFTLAWGYSRTSNPEGQTRSSLSPRWAKLLKSSPRRGFVLARHRLLRHPVPLVPFDFSGGSLEHQRPMLLLGINLGTEASRGIVFFV